MQWQVVVELAGADGEVRRHEVYVGGNTAAVCSAETLGLRLAEAKQILAALQHHVVQAQAEEVLPGAAPLPALCCADATEGPAMPAAEVLIWRRRGSRPALCAVPMQRELARNPLPDFGNPARPLHAVR